MPTTRPRPGDPGYALWYMQNVASNSNASDEEVERARGTVSSEPAVPEYDPPVTLGSGRTSPSRGSVRVETSQDAADISLIDPVTGRNIGPSLQGLREGAGAGRDIVAHGFALDRETERRREDTIGLLQSLLDPNGMQGELESYAREQLRNPGSFDEELVRLIFARGADAASTGARRTAQTVGSMLGGRGISASSPLAAGLSAAIEMNRTSAVRGVERDVTIEKLRQDTQDRALAFQNALAASQQRNQLTGALANVYNQQVPGYGYDALSGLTELIIERNAQEEARRSAKKSSKNNLIGSVIGGIAGIASAFI